MKAFLKLAAALFFGCAALTAIRLASADTIARQFTPDAVAKAIAMDWPAPAAELEQSLAELAPLHARESLTRAVEANPRLSAAWISLGLLDEASGNPSAAEQSLRRAALVDHQYLPAWTLANFHFRHADRKQFWVWADRAASLAYGDLGPLLRLCDQFEPDPDQLLAHFQHPRRLHAPYLNFLIGEHRLDDAQPVARAMSGDRANDPYLIGLADRQVHAGNAEAAIELWNIASSFPPLDPSAGKILTNGNLERAPLNLGFDWRLGQADGVLEKWQPSELVFTFTGSQPEACVLLEQTIYSAPGHLRLAFDYLSNNVTGLHWSLDEIEGPPIAPSSQWIAGAFDLPRARGLRNLKLFYRREPGTIRAEGRVEVRNLRLEAL